MRIIILASFLLLSSISRVFSGDTLTLNGCFDEALKNYPLIKQKKFLDSINTLKINNLNKSYLPQIYINSQATYQSDVTEVSFGKSSIPQFSMPQIPSADKDQYKITLDVNQIIYDGGQTSKFKEIENLNLLVDKQNNEVELYKIKDRVNQLYFGILLFQENEKILFSIQEDLKNKLKKVKSGVQNGIALSVNEDVLKSEFIKTEQQLLEIQLNKASFIKMLNLLSGLNITINTILRIPEVVVNTDSSENNRAELKLFDYQKSKIDAMSKTINLKTTPKVICFGQLGYGKPGLNMFKNEFDSYYIVGAKLSWNIWNWNQNKTEKQIIEVQKNIIDNQKEVFDKNTKISLEAELANISKYNELLKKDLEIIELKNKIVKVSESQLDNGIITTSEYVSELLSQNQAKLNYESHKIQLVKSKISYLNIQGKL